MNRSKIEWCDHTWNPITGCWHNCEYCYARKMSTRFAGDVRLNKMAKKDYFMVPAADSKRKLYVLDAPMLNETGNPLVYPFGFEPTFHRYRQNMLDKLKMGNNIFVGAMADIWGTWVPDEWIKWVLDICQTHPIHNYLFLTKNPDRYVELCLKDLLPEAQNMWYGVTVTNAEQAYTAEAAMQDMPSDAHAFLSIEPLLEELSGALEIIIANFTDWVIIGAETGHRKNKVVPKKEWVEDIVRLCGEVNVPVFIKNSLIPIVGEENMRKEFPKQLQQSGISPKMEARLFALCANCKSRMRKNDMITLMARSMRGEQAKQFGFMCKGCFRKFCNDLELQIPELERMKGTEV
ncbi:DUF5131 family protein [Candidatus Merdisoma sp. JLR.KK006]|uniref:DUF5131 family protein n=1 Tax=Candidatus Merdisoma sp. JLR.KK006 TaxID=3112626 RepID=UPI002FF0C6E3